MFQSLSPVKMVNPACLVHLQDRNSKIETEWDIYWVGWIEENTFRILETYMCGSTIKAFAAHYNKMQ